MIESPLRTTNFNSAWGITWGGNNSTDCRVWQVDTNDRLQSVAGNGLCGLREGDGDIANGGNTRLNTNVGVRMDGRALLIDDHANNTIRRVGGDGVIDTVMGDGAPSLS